MRYFKAVNEISDRQIEVFTDVDHDSRVGLVAMLGGQMIAAGTYHRDPTGNADAAEAAFLVEDSQQGRGLGSILLEHLAAAARERGIRRFTAEVLGQNTKMLGVFMDAGYTVHREYDSGVIDLAFDIEPTEKSRAVMTAREHRAEARSIARLLAPRSIAVIGASDEPATLGHIVLENLLRGKFSGPVYPVTPDIVSVQGVRAYASVTDIPDPVDLAVVTVPDSTAAEVVAACRAKGVHGLVVMTAGFADEALAGDLLTNDGARRRRARRRRAGRRRRGAGAGRVGPQRGHAGARPELPGPGQHRSVGADERDPGAGDPAGGPDRVLLPVRCVGCRDPGRRREPRARLCRRSSRPATGPTCPATTCCSSGTATTGPRWCCCTWSRSAIPGSSPGWPGCWPGRNRSSR